MSRKTGFPVIMAEALDALRRRIGEPVRRPEPYIETATRDAVRHWAAGIGDRNPFWLDAGVAPPTILFAMDRIVSGYVGGLPGIHAMYGGTDFRWQRPIRIPSTMDLTAATSAAVANGIEKASITIRWPSASRIHR